MHNATHPHQRTEVCSVVHALRCITRHTPPGTPRCAAFCRSAATPTSRIPLVPVFLEMQPLSGCLRNQPPNLFHVLLHLLDERLGRVEALFVAQPREEGELHPPSVQVAVEVDQMRL